MVEVSQDNFIESEADLTNVDYQIFYDELAGHGEWIQINMNEVDIKQTDPTSSSLFNKNFFIKSAMAQMTAEPAVAFVWRPAVVVDLEEGEIAWQPYSRGEWVMTDNGWYFLADSEPMEITHHYGRWWNSPDLGWVWLPGKVWSPAWVTWRESDDLIAWSPVPPNVFIVNNSIPVVQVPVDNFVVVPKQDFTRPEIYKYMRIENRNNTIIHEMRKLDGPMVVNHTIINRGPEVRTIEAAANTTIKKRMIDRVNRIRDIRDRSDDVIRTFIAPLREVRVEREVKKDQRRVRNVNVPGKFKPFDEVKREVKIKEKDGRIEVKEKIKQKNDNRDKDNKKNMNRPQGDRDDVKIEKEEKKKVKEDNKGRNENKDRGKDKKN
jgi:hypothetical protein